MIRYGFTPSPVYWWHFDYELCHLFPILDIPFEELLCFYPGDLSPKKYKYEAACQNIEIPSKEWIVNVH
jgi:hypothetical protein